MGRDLVRLGALAGELARFGTVGAGATLMHLAVAWIANRGLGVPPYTANAMGFGVAFTLSYLGHFFWTFGRDTGHRRHLPRFLVVAACGYGLTNLVIWLVVGRLSLPFEAALAAIVVVVPAFTWVLSRIWAFRPGQVG